MTPELLVTIWNENRGRMRICAGLEISKRKEIAKDRIHECSDPERWRAAILRAAVSPFLTGMVPTRESPAGFVANFDWLIKPDTLVRIEEGTFDTTELQPPETIAPKDLSYWDRPKPNFSLSDDEIMDAQVNGLTQSYDKKNWKRYERMTRAELEQEVLHLRSKGILWSPTKVREITGAKP